MPDPIRPDVEARLLRPTDLIDLVLEAYNCHVEEGSPAPELVADDDADLPHFEHEGAREHRVIAQRSRADRAQPSGGEDDDGAEIIDTIDAGTMTGQEFPEP